MANRTLILAIDMQGMPEWHANACKLQLSDWLEANKTILPIEHLIILPTNGDTKLFWLEGEDIPEDINTLEQIRDRIKPVLELSLNISIDKTRQYKDPYKGKLSPMQKAQKALKHGNR